MELQQLSGDSKDIIIWYSSFTNVFQVIALLVVSAKPTPTLKETSIVIGIIERVGNNLKFYFYYPKNTFMKVIRVRLNLLLVNLSYMLLKFLYLLVVLVLGLFGLTLGMSISHGSIIILVWSLMT